MRTPVQRLRAAGCVFAEEEAALLLEAAHGADELDQLITRREQGEPLEYIVGFAEFLGTRIRLSPGVFIPRRRTEALAIETLERLRERGERSVVVDLCCGSGALGAVVARRKPGAEVYAADIDPVAVACARSNLDDVYVADLFDGLPDRLRGRIDAVMANVPYVPTRELDAMPVEAREHEPRATHDGGNDGHHILRRVLADAPDWIRPGGVVLTEIAAEQIETARRVFRDAGLDLEIVTSEEHDATVAVGTVS